MAEDGGETSRILLLSFAMDTAAPKTNVVREPESAMPTSGPDNLPFTSPGHCAKFCAHPLTLPGATT